MKYAPLALGMLILSFGAAHAQTKAFDPESLTEVGIGKAKADVAMMKKDELRALLNYFAECSDRLRPPTQACRAASIRYQVEFKSTRAVDATMTAIEQVHEIRTLVRSTGVTPTGDGKVEAAEEAIRNAVGAALRASPG